MQTQTSIYIPKPCHEDWNKMTPTQQGKFCSACSKQVIDFSLMSDNQILNLLSHQSGKLCGRFDAEQLQRPLIETKIKKKKSWWMALTMPLLFLFDRSHAQGTVSVIKPDTTVTPIFKQPEVMGKLIYHPLKQIIINGKIVDGNNNPIAFASIIQKGTNHGTTADSLGNFSIEISSYEDSVTLAASCIGYEAREKTFSIHESNANIEMIMQPAIAGEVIVVGYTGIRRTTGLMSSITRVTMFEKIDSSFRKAIGTSKVFPNPAMKGSAIHFEIKTAGKYQMQLLDNQSRLIQTEEINIASEKSAAQIQLSSNIAAGIYYLRLINEQTKKQYTEKLIIQ